MKQEQLGDVGFSLQSGWEAVELMRMLIGDMDRAVSTLGKDNPGLDSIKRNRGGRTQTCHTGP